MSISLFIFRSRSALLTALLFHVFVAAPSARAANYFVAPTGMDARDGSQATPWQTLQHAADAVVAGDTVTVLPGTYKGFSLGWDNPQNGAPGMPIRFLAMPGVIINAPNAHTKDGINLEGSSWIVLDGFEVTGVGRAGIRSVSNGNGNAQSVTITNNNCHDNAVWGIFTSHVDNLLIAGNQGARSQQQHGIYVSNACVNPTVRGNRLFGNAGAGLHMNGDISQGGTGIITGAVIENNIIYDNGKSGGSGINCDGVQMSTFRNNLVYLAHASGMSLYQIDAAQPAKNNLVVNNTIVVAADGRWALNIQNGSTGNTVYNNILLDNNPRHGSIDTSADSQPGLISDYNVVNDRLTPDDNTTLTLAQWRAQTMLDQHSLVAAEAMLFKGAGDYHLIMGSPAIDKGTAMRAPGVDLEGVMRPQGAGFDIGAYEFCGGAGCMMVSGDMAMGAGADLSVMGDAARAGDDAARAGDDAAGSGAPAGGCGCAIGKRAGAAPVTLAVLVIVLGGAVMRRRRAPRN